MYTYSLEISKHFTGTFDDNYSFLGGGGDALTHIITLSTVF